MRNFTLAFFALAIVVLTQEGVARTRWLPFNRNRSYTPVPYITKEIAKPVETRDGGAPTKELSADQISVCKQLGLDPKEVGKLLRFAVEVRRSRANAFGSERVDLKFQAPGES